jgi:hypothetical protein
LRPASLTVRTAPTPSHGTSWTCCCEAATGGGEA